MDDFKTYYLNNFQSDLLKFFEAIPNESKFHEDRERKQIYSIQYSRLKPKEGYLDFLNTKEKSLFGVALFYTVLADMVCYTHFKNHYSAFQNLTQYPKFIGDCPGACYLHFHPRGILEAMNYQLDRSEEKWINFRFVLKRSERFIRKEICDFFENNIQQVDKNEFWSMYKIEIPSYL